MSQTSTITSVPLLDLNRQYATIEDDVLAAMKQVLTGKKFIQGPEVAELEQQIAHYCQTDFAVGVSSGTDALLLAMMALNIGPGDEVITTPFTFFATAGSIARLGAKPIFVDIDPKTYNINPQLIEAAITKKTKAIIPVHLFGQCADMKHILSIANNHNLPVIEDAAQAIGACYNCNCDPSTEDCRSNSSFAGQKGTMGCFSFFPSKNLGACGDAGMVTTSDPLLYEKLKQLRVHGQTGQYKHAFIGGNFRLDALQAAILCVKLPHLDTQHRGRIRNAQYYNTHLNPSLTTPFVQENHRMIYNQYTLRTQNRDTLINALKQAKIGHAVYYPIPLHLQDCFAYLNGQPGDYPEAEKAAQEVLSLPVFPELKEEELAYIANVINTLK